MKWKIGKDVNDVVNLEKNKKITGFSLGFHG